MQSLWMQVVACCGIGLVLGLFFFGLLKVTTARLADCRYPALLFFGSFVVRMAVLLAGLRFVMADRWERAVACLAGILLARTILLAREKRADLQAVSKRAV